MGVFMEPTQEQRCASVGMKVSILCALLGALVPAGMMLKEFLQSLPGGVQPANAHPKWPIPIGMIVTVVALCLIAALLGKIAGKIICRRRCKFGAAALVGVCLALICMLAGIVVASLFTLIAQPSLDSLAIIGIFGLATLIMGALPAVLLGVLYGILVRWRLVKAGCCL
jgi:hypothetical protein